MRSGWLAKIIGGYGPLEGSIRVLPVVDDSTLATKAFIERFRKRHPGRDPSSEVTLNYMAVHATAQAMKLPGTTTSDAAAIRAQLDKAYKGLPMSVHVHGADGVDERGGMTFNTRVAVVENGKVQVPLSALAN
jgi:branched-chain amino acid transport system substrate-binding protein